MNDPQHSQDRPWDEIDEAWWRRAMATEREIQDILAGRHELKPGLPETEPVEVREHEAYLILLQARLRKFGEWLKAHK